MFTNRVLHPVTGSRLKLSEELENIGIPLGTDTRTCYTRALRWSEHASLSGWLFFHDCYVRHKRIGCLKILQLKLWTRLPGSESQLCYLPAVWPGANYLTSLHLGFLICKTNKQKIKIIIINNDTYFEVLLLGRKELLEHLG